MALWVLIWLQSDGGVPSKIRGCISNDPDNCPNVFVGRMTTSPPSLRVFGFNVSITDIILLTCVVSYLVLPVFRPILEHIGKAFCST